MKTASDPRHQKRQAVVQELFAWDAQSHLPEDKQDQSHLDPLTQEVIKNKGAIDQFIARCAPERDVAQLNQIDRAILRLAIYEMALDQKVPSRAVIDEAVELAKEYAGDNSPQFINGVLGNVLTDKDRIRHLVANKLGVEVDKVVSEANITSDLNAGEIEFADLLALLEKDLVISLPSQVAVPTVGELLESISEQLE